MLDAADGVDDQSAGCPEVRVVDGLVADMAAWEEVLGNPNCFTFQRMFPGGFTPQFGSYISDASAVVGLRGTSGRLSWDASAAFGNSSLDFYMYNTVNASLGPDQPCSDKEPHRPFPTSPALRTSTRESTTNWNQPQRRSLLRRQRPGQHRGRRGVA